MAHLQSEHARVTVRPHLQARISAWLEILAIAAQCAIVFMLLAFSLLFTPTFTYRFHVPGPNSIMERMNFSMGLPSLGFIGGLIVFILLVLLVSSLLARMPRRGMLLFLLAFVTVAQLGWILAIDLADYQYPDSSSLMDAAASILQGRTEKFAPDYCTPGNMPTGCIKLPSPYAYFSWYPFQSGPLLWFIGIFALFGIGNITAFQIVNALMVTGITAILWWFGSALGLDRRGLAAFTALCCTCLPLLMYCAFVYTNAVGLCFMLLGALLIGRALAARSNIVSLVLLAIAFVVFGLGMLFKTTYIIVLLAAIIAIALTVLRCGKRYWLLIAVIPLTWVAKTISGLSIRFLESWSGQSFDKSMPMLSWIAIGLDHPKGAVPGWWGPNAVDTWTLSGGDYQVQLDTAKHTIQHALTGFAKSPMSAVEFFVAKLTSEWSEPTFMTGLYSQMGRSASGFSGVAGVVLNPKGGFVLDYENVAMSGMYLFAFVGIVALVRRLFVEREQSHEADAVYARSLLSVAFLGGFLCYVLWEAKGIYTLPFYLMLIPLAAYGVQAALAGISQLNGIRRSRSDSVQ
ncbi:hypothetical protein [Bifidobacterium miconisargentati]|uniref:hypothetical protein n=1 Tax=Bifidobacterium miconisargentati TaxID=2834437 RepID=UPI001BDD93DB|nr:hypothetical protein [Bifidobacterium miconisargentati]MBW3091183.1 hypothetical protein [Bifidobacterium miconisargentati]